MLLLYVTTVTALDRRPPPSFAFHFLPGGVVLGRFLAALAAGDAPRLPPVEWMLLYQFAYTVLSARRFLATRSGSARWGLHRFWVPCLMVVLVLQHASQLLRWLFRHESALRDIVPMTGAASFVVVTLIGLRKALPLLGRQQRRYAGSTLAPERAEATAGRLRELMERDRPYLRPGLTLDELAAALGIPKTHLSQILNQTLGQTFLDFLTSYRIGESERLLLDHSTAHLTIEAVGRDSGFRSRSSFYDAFRKAKGMTPADFRRRAPRS
jgi:AraC-like DNA-binding protein